MGGVINIITKTAQKPLEASGRINYGSFDTQTYRPAFRGFSGPFQWSIDLNYSKSNGYRDNDEYEEYSC